LRTHRQWLAEQGKLLERHGIQVTSEVVWVQHPYEEVLQFVNEMPLALIIKDAQQESALKRVFYTPLDWQLLRDCPVPVHLVTDDVHPRPRSAGDH
jgi:universal stress protein E